MRKLIFVVTLLFSVNALYAQNTDVTFKNGDGTITFGGTLSVPAAEKNSGNAVILISGTGKQDRDGNMAGHPWFKVLAAYLVDKGLTVLRTDDRGEGKTTGKYETATTGDFAKDALSAVAYLKSRKELKLKKIGLLGHSEGGAAITIAAAASKDVAFLISLSGLATNGYQAQILQNEDIVAAAPIPDRDKKRYNEINALMFKTALKYADSSTLDTMLNRAYAAWKVKDDALIKSEGVEFDHFRYPIYSYVNNATGPWYRYFIKYDPAPYLAKIKVPILAINGSKDIMVNPAVNLADWKKLSAAGGNKNVKTIELPGLNHLLQHCKTCQIQEYKEIKEDIAPEVFLEIGKWLKEQKIIN
ncbi:alpha/beta hydrolase family protein [Pedobacter soli]|uniref:AB hydrolase-1 domain-containing protein n=1 Tax=Pedobacter soli TaxID=390242 RepID=A0A1G6V975_9SPHI|nr:alpha/beta fold hydrolase [Pedobacter soli]SDD49943.1 hypothetical protein SAMN04488024_10643 [Pedobacter soli]